MDLAVARAKTDWFGFLSAYLVTMRPYLMFVSGITGIVGLALVSNLTWSDGSLVFVASFLSYGFGQALTDCFQVDTDSISAPYRPLTQGTIGRAHVMALSLAGLTFCVGSLAVPWLLNLLLGTTAGIGLATYTYFKRRWWGGPWYNGWIVSVLCIMAFLAGSHGELPLDVGKAAWTLLAVFFGYANFVLSGYFKDISADAATGYRTLPVAFGRSIAAKVSDFLAAVTSLCAMMALGEITLASLSLMVGGTAALLLGQIQLHRISNDAEAHRAITPVVHGYILVLSGIAVSHKPEWMLLLLVFYGGFVVTMGIRPAKHQI